MTRRAPSKGNVFRPAPYEELQCNDYLGRDKHIPEPQEIPTCQCKPFSQGGTACSTHCHNRYTNHECHPSYCPSGQDCSNQQIQRHQGAKTRLQHMGAKGWGLVAAQPVPAGAFVIEYIGEVVSPKEAAQRIHRYEAEGQHHTYFMNISANAIIDATKRANRARFINHSCDPNCETQKWVVDGRMCVCIFALRDIQPGEELTYHYHLTWHGSKRPRCQCGSVHCSGYLGSNPGLMRNSGEDDMFAQVDEGCETYDSDPQLAAEQAAPTACGIFTLTNGVLQQAPAVSAIPSPDKQHSPDSSATVTGGPCSDASDLTSSHHEHVHAQKQHKRVKLTVPDETQQPAQHAAQHHHIHVSAAGQPQPPADDLGTAALPTMHLDQYGQGFSQQTHHQLPGNSLPILESVGHNRHKHPSHSRHRYEYAPHSSETVSERLAPAYTPYHIPGLTAQQQAVKDLEDQELAQALRQQQNVYQVGYDVDEFGTVQLPRHPHARVVPMKHVFAQRWQQQQQQAAQLSLSCLLLSDATVLEGQGPFAANGPMPDHQLAGMAQPDDCLQTSVPAAHAKLPLRFQLSQAKQAMRKAESGSPNISCTMSNGTERSQLQDANFTAWQMEQLATSSAIHDPFVEQHIDGLNASFETSYWSMLEHLIAC